MKVLSQSLDYRQELEAHRKSLNDDFLNPNKSPLSKEEREAFIGHQFYPIDEAYRVVARFEATPEAKPFALSTSKGTTQLFKRLGILHFELKGQPYTLEVYLRVQRFMPQGQKNYVFLPVIDETTGEATYGAGRYLHYEGVPEGNEWIIDFNKLYNPSCAYNENFECPVVPEPNHLSTPIEAGIKGY